MDKRVVIHPTKDPVKEYDFEYARLDLETYEGWAVVWDIDNNIKAAFPKDKIEYIEVFDLD